VAIPSLTAAPDKTNQMKCFKELTGPGLELPQGCFQQLILFRGYLKLTVVIQLLISLVQLLVELMDFYPFPCSLKNLVHFNTPTNWGHFGLKESDMWPYKKWATV